MAEKPHAHKRLFTRRENGRCLSGNVTTLAAVTMAWKLLNPAKAIMDSSGHLPISESAARYVRNSKTRRKRPTRPKNAATVQSSNKREPAAVGSLTRTKALLLAALRVWELKYRMRK